MVKVDDVDDFGWVCLPRQWITRLEVFRMEVTVIGQIRKRWLNNLGKENRKHAHESEGKRSLRRDAIDVSKLKSAMVCWCH